jgi:hypothetical protein
VDEPVNVPDELSRAAPTIMFGMLDCFFTINHDGGKIPHIICG